jgi:proteasome activator subunit 4
MPVSKAIVNGSISIPDISRLTIRKPTLHNAIPQVEEEKSTPEDRYMQKLKNYANALPYSIEPNSRMQEMLDFIILRITQCVEAKDYDPGLTQWDSMLT